METTGLREGGEFGDCFYRGGEIWGLVKWNGGSRVMGVSVGLGVGGESVRMQACEGR